MSSAICLLDTSVLVHILGVPNMGNAEDEQAVFAEFSQKIEADEEFFIALSVIIETGNHIGHIQDGKLRRACSQRFVGQMKQVLNGNSPFKQLRFINREELALWLDDFTTHSTCGRGMGDMALVKMWEELCALNVGRRVYIWTLDSDLTGYDQPAQQ